MHDLAAYGKPPADFRWDRYAHLLIDDEYLRREGLLWLSELRSKPNFPKIVRVPVEAGPRHKPPAEIEVKAPPLPPKREPKAAPAPEAAAAEIKPIRQDVKAASRPAPGPTSSSDSSIVGSAVANVIVPLTEDSKRMRSVVVALLPLFESRIAARRLPGPAFARFPTV